MNRSMYIGLTAVMAVYTFCVGFVLTICIFMSNADSSPEVSLTSSHPLRSVLLLALVFWPFITMLAIGQNPPIGLMLLVPLCLCVTGVGLVCATSDHGSFEAFSGIDGLRRTTGKVYIIVSLIVLTAAIWRTRADRLR